MKLQNLTVIFIIIIIPVILLVSLYITTGIKTIKYQSLYDTGLLTATHDAIYAFELNTTNDAYSDNAETKRNILKSSVKAFEKSLCNTCNISSYNVDEIEEYIPAIVFVMYDGFYMYAPSLNPKTGKYEHSLKNYVYYSEKLGEDGATIRYSLDNYVVISGYFQNTGKYETKEGYLINPGKWKEDSTEYNGIKIIDSDAVNYYKEACAFTNDVLSHLRDNYGRGNLPDFLAEIQNDDLEDPNSAFAQHRNQVIKNKIESVLNSSITAYSERTWGHTYKMPKLSEEDWQKIYSNISMITFFQGKSIGLTKYNGYCVLNSTNHNEYVNPNLMYFINGSDDTANYYHDIRCTDIKDVDNAEDLKGYKIGDFQKIKLEEPDDNGNYYKFKHNALACYDCINGSLSASTSVYDYVKPNGGTARAEIKTAYWNSLARERYNTIKLLKENGSVEEKEYEEYDYIEIKNNNCFTINTNSLSYKNKIELKINILDNTRYKDVIYANYNGGRVFAIRRETSHIKIRRKSYNETIISNNEFVNKVMIITQSRTTSSYQYDGEARIDKISAWETWQNSKFDATDGKLYLGNINSRIYYLKIYDATGNLINELIPVKKKNDGKSYLYDKITNQYYSCNGAEAKNINEA